MKSIGELYELQKQLDARIIKEKGLEGQDLLPNTILALQVEICELANEWRGFKHWSNDRVPRIAVGLICATCKGEGEIPDLANGFGFMKCPDCRRSGVVVVNRLLEEYVDCLHFFLSIARQLDLPEDDLYMPDDVLEGETSTVFTELLHHVGLIGAHEFRFKSIEDRERWQKEHYQIALYIFNMLGEQRLGFTWDQIAEAYLAKNKVNHERQENGY